MVTIAETHDAEAVRALFVEYAASLGISLEFQNFDEELRDPASVYTTILLAAHDAEPIGCVALRTISADVCEMKRLFVRPKARGRGLGRLLAESVIADARRRGFSRMLLDTLPTMTTAIAMYETLGFRDVEPYRPNPIEGARFLGLSL